MNVLGIETSCDDTGIAVYSTKEGLLSQELHTQSAIHECYGGVVPELAARDHIRHILPLTKSAISRSGLSLSDIHAIAYTEGPGLPGALLVGAAFGASLAYSLNIPCIGIHHLEGHLLSPFLSENPPTFPFIALLVSGGHTQLMGVEGLSEYFLLGESLDDAAGEAFDKSAKLLGLGYPGGPAIAALAEQGNENRYRVPRPMIHDKSLNFSFSGLKTAVSTLIRSGLPDAQARADLAASVQAAIVDVLVEKTTQAFKALPKYKTVVVAGGVSANKRLRIKIQERAEAQGLKAYFPHPSWCTDNGAMIALAGAMRLSLCDNTTVDFRSVNDFSFRIRPRWDLNSLE